MTTLASPPNTAVLVVDVQDGVVANAYARDQVVATIGRLVTRARQEDVPVVWVQDCGGDRDRGTDPWRIVPELSPADDEPHVNKVYGDSFEDTSSLEDVLADLGVGRLVVTGLQTEACVRNTLHGAFVRWYDTTLVTDVHPTEDLTAHGAPAPEQVIAHTNLCWRYQPVPDRTAETVASADVDFGAAHPD